MKLLLYYDFDCLRSPITAFTISCLAFLLLHSFQNFIVALSGFIVGCEIKILVGNKEASPTTNASPISKIGRTYVSPARLSVKSLLITVWSSALESRNEIKLLH